MFLSKTMGKQIWTALNHSGPNHLGLRPNHPLGMSLSRTMCMPTRPLERNVRANVHSREAGGQCAGRVERAGRVCSAESRGLQARSRRRRLTRCRWWCGHLAAWTVRQNDGPDHLGLRRNAFPSAPNGLDHLGIVCPSGGHSPPEARRRHTCWPAVDGRRRVSLQLQEGFSVGIAAVSRGSPAAPAPLAR